MADLSEQLSVAFDRSGHQLTVYLVGELDPATAPGYAKRYWIGSMTPSANSGSTSLS